MAHCEYIHGGEKPFYRAQSELFLSFSLGWRAELNIRVLYLPATIPGRAIVKEHFIVSDRICGGEEEKRRTLARITFDSLCHIHGMTKEDVSRPRNSNRSSSEGGKRLEASRTLHVL